MIKQHRFKVGQTVKFARVSLPGQTKLRADTPSDLFRVVRLLPDYKGVNQYRIQSTRDSHQRVVTETEIITQ